ncbi:MAG: histidine phosphatase family protein [Alphaproteobacteria bacterium]|nr:histidine phosphatase family protein [Alphaproteobacteria bacterium]
MKIALLRHGPTEWNAAGRIQGHTDIALSDAGLAKMSGLRLPFVHPRLYASPLLRARQTVEALGLADAVLDARLMEQNWGAWEGLTREEIFSRHGADAFEKAGSREGETFRPGGGESTGELHARVAAFLKDVAQGEGDAVAVAHLGVLRAAYTMATGWDMATPMPADLDVSKILLLRLDRQGAAKIEALNMEFAIAGPAARPSSRRS